jgi:hypothetical protein
MADYSNWAQRRSGRGNQPPQTERAPTAPARPPRQLDLPPPGYVWATHPTMGYVLVPLAQVSAPTTGPTFVPPPRQPSGLVPFVPQPITSQFPPGHPTARVETCMLVKPGDRDTYAEVLAGLPDLVPDNGGYDAMAGHPAPLTVQECGSAIEFAQANDGQAMRAYPEGSVLARGSTPLKGS